MKTLVKNPFSRAALAVLAALVCVPMLANAENYSRSSRRAPPPPVESQPVVPPTSAPVAPAPVAECTSPIYGWREARTTRLVPSTDLAENSDTPRGGFSRSRRAPRVSYVEEVEVSQVWGVIGTQPCEQQQVGGGSSVLPPVTGGQASGGVTSPILLPMVDAAPAAQVPEPSVLALFGLGAAGLLVAKRRRRI